MYGGFALSRGWDACGAEQVSGRGKLQRTRSPSLESGIAPSPQRADSSVGEKRWGLV